MEIGTIKEVSEPPMSLSTVLHPCVSALISCYSLLCLDGLATTGLSVPYTRQAQSHLRDFAPAVFSA